MLFPFIVNPHMDHDLLLQLGQLQPELAFRGSNSAKDLRSDQRYHRKRNTPFAPICFRDKKKALVKLHSQKLLLKNECY